ncbi:FAD/NAD(P)-binding domain-containing protein [Glonium stellatum]|uniref:FAD/NAD(P)-binding domain-containing protein n=1 Tax=Glonium stellatum TaxID=574774 RepID=A0A8E2JXU5_9PEZI|nr:FAD/NAD(P)-binding domain-containing protein [Glonium stellatum]
MNTSNYRINTIAIVGAGPSGLAAAKYFLAEKSFDRIDIFEQRSSVGGIWNYTPEDRDEDIFTVPQTDPSGRVDEPIWRTPSQLPHAQNKRGEQIRSKRIASFISPLYERLETNIPRGLMGFSDLNWPQDSQLFPKHETVLEYIQRYGQDVMHLVKLETQVVDVRIEESGTNKNSIANKDGWRVKTRDLATREEKEGLYDAVVVANGHFIVPYVPNIERIKEWNERYPGIISHSKYFRRPEEFSGKKVVVVGNSASGIDVSSQVAAYGKTPILCSQKSTSMLIPAPDPRKFDLPQISTFILDNRSIRFEDGRVESDIDAIVFCTGYFYSLPFLKTLGSELISGGTRVQHTYLHLFYSPRPTLSFLALPQRVIPFPVAEAQGSILARVYSGRLSLPPYEEMRKWEDRTITEMGPGRSFHLLPFPKDANYINHLSNWALTAPLKEGLDNGGKGKIPPTWGPREFWTRETFPKIRRAFAEKQEERSKVRSINELGFNYEECLEEKAINEAKLL